MMRFMQVCAAFGLLLVGEAVLAGPHVHGVGRLDAAIDGGRIELQLSIPAIDLVGFERAARTDAERQRLDAVRAQLLDHARLWQFSVAAGCTAQPPVVVVGGARDGHGDWEARYRFDCAQPAQLRRLTSRLFEQFPRVQRLDVQLIGAAGASAFALQASQPSIEMPR